jgi:hypothetical protein
MLCPDIAIAFIRHPGNGLKVEWMAGSNTSNAYINGRREGSLRRSGYLRLVSAPVMIFSFTTMRKQNKRCST